MKKKFCSNRDYKYSVLIKPLRVMKITVFLLLVSVAGVFANKSYSQTKMLNLNMPDATVKEILKSIEEQSEFYFLYSENLIDAGRKVNVNVKNKKIDEALSLIFEGTNVNYSIRDRIIVLTTPEVLKEEIQVQQLKSVSGTVTDESGLPLPGVTVLVKGTTHGTVTNVNGEYTLANIPDNATLLFSFVGMKTQDIVPGTQSTINVVMMVDAYGIDEVVAIGYGVQKKVNVIGSVANISSEELSSSPVSNISNALAGRLPGAVIQQSNGEPGNDAASIHIRGLATLGNNEPLVVIDGIPGRDLNSINTNDIESISILKDASAAIYGARAANGVILVVTKKGTENKPLTVNYSFYQGFSNPTVLPKMADAATYAEMIREVQTYNGVDEANMKFSIDDIQKYKSGQYPWTHPNTNWFDAALANFSQTRNHNIDLSGGNINLNYYVSFGALYQDGIFKNSSTEFNRYNIKTTVNAKLNEYLTIGVDINGIVEDRNYPSIDAGWTFDGVIKSLPTSPAYYPNGLPGPDIAYGQNPVVTATEKTGFNDSKRYIANNTFSANLKVPGMEGLILSGYYAYDLNFGQRKLFQKPWKLYQLDEAAYLAAGNTGTEDGSVFLVGTEKGTTEPWLRNYYDDAKTKTVNLKAEYTKTINDVHNIHGFIAYETSDYKGKGIDAFRRYFISDQLPYLFAGGDAEKDNSEFVNIDSRINYFGRLSYNYKETYIFQFSYRRDGSLRFSEERGRWGNFPSFLAGWRVSNEKFWKNHVQFIDFFKLKASWGKLGNDLVLPFQYLSSYGFSTGSVFGSDKNYSAGLSQLGVSNPNITWEVANIFNTGFEAMFLDSKLSLNADFFYQRRNNILVKRNASVPEYTGIQLPDENFGIVHNKGFELELSYANKVNDWFYSVNANFAFARNKIVEFDEPAKNVPWQVLTGHPQGSQLLYKSMGIFKDEAQINSMPHVPGAHPGDIIIEDVSGDGEITAEDMVLFPKTINPEITYSLSFNLKYKNWGLKGLVQGAGNSWRRMYYELQGFAGNYFEYDAIGRWTPDNIDADKPRAFDRNDAYWRADYVTDYSYQSTAFVRMKNLELVYTLPEKVKQMVGLKNAEVYVSGQNLFLIYSGNKITDPEIGGNVEMGAYQSNAAIYPLMRVFAIGARITL